MGRRQDWVQTEEEEDSVEQLHAFVRYLSGVRAAAAVLFQQSRPLIRILRGHLRHADMRAMHRAVSVILCRTSAHVSPFDAIP